MGRIRWVVSAAAGARAVSGTWADRRTGGLADRSRRADRGSATTKTAWYGVEPTVGDSDHPRASFLIARRTTLSTERDVPLCHQQLRVEDRRSRRPADGVVAQGHEPVAEHRVPRDAAYGDAHATARLAVEARLRAVRLVAHDDGAGGGRGEPELLRQSGKRRKGLAQLRR